MESKFGNCHICLRSSSAQKKTTSADQKLKVEHLNQDFLSKALIQLLSFCLLERERDIKMAKNVDNLSDLKVLSLSHIFSINNIEEGKSVTKLLDSDGDRKIVLDNFYSSIEVQGASSEAMNYCKDISGREIGQLEPKNNIDCKIKACCHYLLHNNNFSVQVNSETSFMQSTCCLISTKSFLPGVQRMSLPQ